MNNKKMIMWCGLGAISIARSAYAKVLQNLGWEVYVYSEQEPILDFMKKVEPRAIFLGNWELSRAVVKSIQQRPHLEIVLWASNYGTADKDIIASGHEVLRATPEELVFVEQIRQTNKLDNCFQYYSQRCMEYTHDHWKRDFGLEIHGVPLAACVHDYSPGSFNPALASDANIISGHWRYKSINLKKYIYPLALVDNFNLKVFGYGDWQIPNFLGNIATENMKHVFASSKVSLSSFEPLVDLGFDCSERIFKVMSSGGFCVSQYCDTAVKDIVPPNTIVFAEENNPQDFIDKVIHYKNHPEGRLSYIENGIAYAYSAGTYYHRMKDISAALGWMEETIQLNSVIKGLQEQIPTLQGAARRNHELLLEYNNPISPKGK